MGFWNPGCVERGLDKEGGKDCVHELQLELINVNVKIKCTSFQIIFNIIVKSMLCICNK